MAAPHTRTETTTRRVTGPEEYARLVPIWRSAVDATHDFLAEADRDEIESRLAPDYFPQVDLHVAERGGEVVGFAGVSGTNLEMLFVDASYHGKGIGTALLSAAVAENGVTTVDVNEQNPQAVEFYLRRNFRIVGRSPVDDQGRPYPLLHMALGGEETAVWNAKPDRQLPDDVAQLLASVPEWFGQPESNVEYIEAARVKETWSVRDAAGRVVGVTLVDRHFPHVAEVHLTVVDRAVHGSGVGTAMLRAIEDDAIRRGVRLLEVKTLGPSHPDAGYARTRHFYAKQGFLPLEETELWGEGTPCLIMVKPLPAPDASSAR